MRHRKLNDGCEWILDGMTFSTDAMLDAYIQNKIEQGVFTFDSGKLKINQSVDLQQRAVNIVEKIKDEVAGVATLVTPGTKSNLENNPTFNESAEEVESYYIIPNSIGVNKFLQTIPKPGTNNLFVEPFLKDAWRQRTLAAMIDPANPNRVTEAVANGIIQAKEDSWPYLSETGTEVHKVFEQVFNGEIPIRKDTAKLSQSVFDSLVRQANDLKRSILEKYPDAKFYTELGIITKDISPEVKPELDARNLNSVNGKIDLLVIDKQGNAHVYDFKVSRKELGDINVHSADVRKSNNWWDYGKLDSASYQLAFYAAMLKQKGIAVRSANIVPVKIDLTYGDPENEVDIKSIDNVIIKPIASNLPNILSGKYGGVINQTVVQPIRTSSEDIVKLLDVFNQFFPKNTTQQRIEDLRANIDHYKNNPKYTVELRPGDKKADQYKYKFTKWGLSGHPIVYVENEEKLNSVIEDYITKINSANADFCQDFGHKIQDIIAGQVEEDSLYEGFDDVSQSWVKSRFSRYFKEGWSLDSNEEMLTNGIFIFSLGNKSEVVLVERMRLNTTINLGLGESILGKNTKDKYIDRLKVLEASNGNLALMKAMIYISQHQSDFNTKPITEVSVINLEENEEMTHLNSRLINNFNMLCDKNPNVDIQKISANVFFDDIEACQQNAESRLSSEDISIFGLVNPQQNEPIRDYLQKQIKALRSKFPELARLGRDEAVSFDTPAKVAYWYLNQALLSCTGEFTANEVEQGNWFSKGMKLNGYFISSPQYSTSTDLRQLGALLQNYESDVARTVYQKGWKMEQLFIKLYEEGGNGTQVFKDWLRRNPDGSIDERLLLKDPESPEFNGSETTRKALDTFLRTIAELKRPNLTDADVEQMKATLEYYELPLTEAVWSRQFKGNINDNGLVKGVVKTIRDKWKEITTLTKNVFAEDEVDAIVYNSKGHQLYNKFDLKGNTPGSARMQKIQEHGVGFFETNIEVIFNQALVAFTRTEIAKDYIPRINAMKLGLMYAKDHGGIQNTKIQQAFEKIVKTKFYGESIIEEFKPLYKWLSFVRSIFTTMTLSINVPSFLRESLQGIYTGLSRSGVKLMPGIDGKVYREALSYVIQNSHKNFSSVSMLQQLNAIYQMANQSINQIANQRRVNWCNIKNWGKDTLFLTATAPDFMHRVSILVAKMMGDGCWDAHYLIDGKLVYDFKKDKRFEQYLANNTSHKDYLAQKGLYETMIEEFNKAGYTKEDGTPLKIGDDLPRAYTPKEAQGIKNYADLLYGHYDESSRALLNDMFLGSFILQYKTYITAKFEQWMMPQGIYNTAQLKQQFDPITGEELYQVISYDEENRPSRNIVKKSQITQDDIDSGKARIYYDYDGIPMEGLFQEFGHFAKSIAKMDFKTFRELWNNPNDRGFFLLALHDQFLMAFLMFLAVFIFGNVVDADNPWDPTEVGRKVREMGPFTQLMYNVFQGSTVDAQFIGLAGGNNGILQGMAANPPMLTAIQRFSSTNMKMIMGKQSFAYTAAQNIGAIRTFQGLLKSTNQDE